MRQVALVHAGDVVVVVAHFPEVELPEDVMMPAVRSGGDSSDTR
jgi:hypothetical protein